VAERTASQTRSPVALGSAQQSGTGRTGVVNHPGAVIRRLMCCVGGVRVRPATMCDLLDFACDGELQAAPAVTCVLPSICCAIRTRARIRTRAHTHARARTTLEHSRATRRARPHFAHPLQPAPTARELLTDLRPPTPHPLSLPSQPAPYRAKRVRPALATMTHDSPVSTACINLYCMRQPLIASSPPMPTMPPMPPPSPPAENCCRPPSAPP